MPNQTILHIRPPEVHFLEGGLMQKFFSNTALMLGFLLASQALAEDIFEPKIYFGPNPQSRSAEVIEYANKYYKCGTLDEKISAAVADYGKKQKLYSEYSIDAPIVDFLSVKSSKDVVFSLPQLESMQLMEAELDETPWSDTFWPDKLGSVANAYDKNFIPMSFSWNIRKLSLEPSVKRAQEKFSELSYQDLADLSPAQKYDIIVGDTNFTFTKSVMNRIDAMSDNKQTALWSGVCHGWSPASMNVARPTHSIHVPLADGRSLAVYPADIKALASYLWGQSFVQGFVKVSGRQCKSGAKRNKHNRLEDPDCFDVNPGFFHLAITNQIGIKKKGMVMDRSYEKRVMNQPLYKYKYSYFNPIDQDISVSTQRVKTRSFRESVIPLSALKKDPFAEYRSKRAKYIVGIEMEVFYALETIPKHRYVDFGNHDAQESNLFYYELELDDSLNVVGGEWVLLRPPVASPKNGGYVQRGYWYKHPDIIWTIPDGMKAFSVADGDLNNIQWDASTPAPAEFKQASIKAAKNTGMDYMVCKRLPWPQPLQRVVDALVEKSREENGSE